MVAAVDVDYLRPSMVAAAAEIQQFSNIKNNRKLKTNHRQLRRRNRCIIIRYMNFSMEFDGCVASPPSIADGWMDGWMNE